MEILRPLLEPLCQYSFGCRCQRYLSFRQVNQILLQIHLIPSQGHNVFSGQPHAPSKPEYQAGRSVFFRLQNLPQLELIDVPGLLTMLGASSSVRQILGKMQL
jgi:hypothetical protein